MLNIKEIHQALLEQPESIDVDILKNIIQDFLKLSTEELHQLPIYTLELLRELADKQWHTYQLLDSQLLIKLDQLILKLWDSSSLESTELVTAIICTFGLDGSYQKLKLLAEQNYAQIPSSILSDIRNAINECGSDVKNPYHELEVQIKVKEK